MCINKETMKCCGKYSLTHATMAIGGLYLVYAIVCAVSGQWFSFCMGLLASGLFIGVCWKREDILLRKRLFYAVTVLTGLSILGMIVTVIVITASDYLENVCWDDFNDDEVEFLN